MRDDRPVPLYLACAPVGGMHAGDQRYSARQISLKHTDRVSANQSAGIRSKSVVRPTGGRVHGAFGERRISKNEQRKMRRYGK